MENIRQILILARRQKNLKLSDSIDLEEYNKTYPRRNISDAFFEEIYRSPLPPSFAATLHLESWNLFYRYCTPFGVNYELKRVLKYRVFQKSMRKVNS